MVEYKYDAWGKPLSITGTLAATLGKLNPFRYRGYVYDDETGLYYQETRYYSVAWLRFISADQLINASKDLLTHNIFAYCINRPTMYVDRNGMWLDTFFDAVSLVSSIVEVALNPGDPMAWASLAADAVSLAVPGVTGGGKIVRFVCKADDYKDAIKTANNVVDGGKAIKSTINKGKAMHKAYGPLKSSEMISTINKAIPGHRLRRIPDAIDYAAKIVYELKPYNERSFRKGVKQAYDYARIASKNKTKDWMIVVDMYM